MFHPYEKYGDLWDELGLEESRIRNCFTSDLPRFFPIAIIFIGTFMRAIIPHGSLNVPIEHHPTIRYMVYNGYYNWLVVSTPLKNISQLG
jgi:hypothetical protein